MMIGALSISSAFCQQSNTQCDILIFCTAHMSNVQSLAQHDQLLNIRRKIVSVKSLPRAILFEGIGESSLAYIDRKSITVGGC